MARYFQKNHSQTKHGHHVLPETHYTQNLFSKLPFRAKNHENAHVFIIFKVRVIFLECIKQNVCIQSLIHALQHAKESKPKTFARQIGFELPQWRAAYAAATSRQFSPLVVNLQTQIDDDFRLCSNILEEMACQWKYIPREATIISLFVHYQLLCGMSRGDNVWS